MKNILLFFLFILIPALSMAARETFFYVSVTGNDRNPGTENFPFATIERAKDEARQKKGPVTVYLRQGTYYLNQPIEFDERDSCRDGEQLRILSYPNEKVVISGGTLLSGLQWKPYQGKIMQTSIDQELVFDQLFVDDRLQIPARYPNFDPSSSHYNGYSEDVLSPERIARWSDPVGGYIHALHKHEWGDYHWMITGKNKNGALTLEGGYQNNRQMGMHDQFRFVENIFEELDAPGEWFYDNTRKILYFYPPEGMEPASANFTVPQLKCLFSFKGKKDNPVRNISLEDMELTHTLRTFMDTKEQLLRSDWCIYRGGAVRMENAIHCSVKKCFFNAVGGNAVFFSNYNRNNEVSGCHIANVGASGVCFVGDPGAVRSPAFEYNEFVALDTMDFTPGPLNDNYPADCRVYDNLMHDLGQVEKQCAGVHIAMSRDISVSRNTIYDVPRSGININEGTWGGHVIDYNDVFETVLETGDHGTFNSWGRDRFWHPERNVMDSIVEVHPELILSDVVKTIIIRNNRFRCDHGWDIDLDDGSSNYHIYNNVCLNGGLKLREGFHRIVENNILINNTFHPHVWFKNSGDVFRRNIVFAPYSSIGVNYWGQEIDYNVFPDEESLNKARENGTDQHSVAASVEFVDAMTGDYRVRENSPAFAVGFKNFDMDNFGVVSPPLKEKAEKVIIPPLKNRYASANAEIREFMGMQLKNVTTLGERSAAGLKDNTGVWVLTVPAGSKIAGKLFVNDVILALNGVKIQDMEDLKNTVEKLSPGSEVILLVSRNQKEENVKINY